MPDPVTSGSKDTNPKDAVGIRKVPLISVVPQAVIGELALAMLEGARKYHRHNYRIAGVRASVYVDAAGGHITSFWEGEDEDPESRLSHITKAIASLVVLRDAMMQDMWVDDRPPKSRILARGPELNAKASHIIDTVRPDNPAEPYTELTHGQNGKKTGENGSQT